ncbi:MAG: transposase zinc-binding domain-containing protein [Pseudomonadales bacterium]|nr:transposase zinc-binding domain-containing protein [Pseudomonadales bacterium]
MNLISIIEQYQQDFYAKYDSRITHNQKKALGAMLSCRTERYGKMQLKCQSCDHEEYSFHSCGHRSCHNCQHHETSRWLDRQNQKILPVDYFMVTFTLPFELRSLAWHNQKEVYQALFSSAISTLKTFGVNDKNLGADIGGTAVLHTHSRRLDYHPHVHIIIPGGCLNRKRKQYH